MRECECDECCSCNRCTGNEAPVRCESASRSKGKYINGEKLLPFEEKNDRTCSDESEIVQVFVAAAAATVAAK